MSGHERMEPESPVRRPSERGSRFDGRFESSAQARVLVVDKHPVSRRGLSALLRTAGLTVVGEAQGAEGGAAIARRVRPDVIVVDLASPEPDGLDVIRRIRSLAPRAGLVVLFDDHEFDVLRVLATGASACILKDTPLPGIVAAIRAAAKGSSVVSPRLANELVRRMESEATGGSEPADLSPREREVLTLVARGWGNARIAATLYLSHATVKHHISSILEKLGVDNRIQAAVYAVRKGLLDI